MRQTLVLLLLITGGACTSVKVSKVNSSEHQDLSFVCIEENSRVLVSDFLSVVQERFAFYGIATKVYSQHTLPPECDYVLNYTAHIRWDFATWMKSAEIRLSRRGKIIGRANYEHGGGFALNKWDSTEIKLYPVIDQLLSGFQKGRPLQAIGQGLPAEEAVTTAKPDGDAYERLRKLKELRDDGVLTEKEYETKKKEMLEDL